jgi:hypothetical protein
MHVDRLPGGLIMLQMLLIDVVLCAVLIAVAAPVAVLRWRRGGGQLSLLIRLQRKAITGRGGEDPARHGTALVPGFGHEPGAPAAGRRAPAGPGNVAQPRQPVQRPGARPLHSPNPAAPGRAAAPEQRAHPGHAGRPHVRPAAVARPGAGTPGPQPAATNGRDPIADYYAEADRPIAEYLAARGWAEPTARGTG